jgi:adenosylcobinamide kinase/adenosylcobinamide-phosphate guanylyltransferase
VANELFGPNGRKDALSRLTAGLDGLIRQSESLVVVTNELFSDGITYPPETQEYLHILSDLNCRLAQQAQQVYEVVCGIPICWKGASA